MSIFPDGGAGDVVDVLVVAVVVRVGAVGGAGRAAVRRLLRHVGRALGRNIKFQIRVLPDDI